jgi:hypothetical protein
MGPRSSEFRLNPTIMLLLLLAASLATASAPAVGQEPSVSNSELLQKIVERMTASLFENRAKVKSYTVTRAYTLYGKDVQNPRGRVLARVSFLPPDQKSYDIAESSGGMGEKVVRRVLEHEVEVAKDPDSALMIPRNYSFDLLREENFQGRHCYVLKAIPRRDDKKLIRAEVWVDSSTFEIRHVEGEPARNPSFWVKDVHITLEFGEVAGMWLQTATHASAHIRFAGDYSMYSRDLSYETAPTIASGGETDSTAAERAHGAAAGDKPSRRTHTMQRSAPFLADHTGWNER